MKRRIQVSEKELNNNLWIAYAIFKDEDGTINHFQIENDFVHTFGKSNKEAKEKLKVLLQKREDIFDTDIEAFF